MRAKRQRELQDYEIVARKKYGGMTRRQYNLRNRPARPAKSAAGSYTVRALFTSSPNPQEAPFPSEAAALARFDRLSTNPALISVSVLIEQTNSNGYKRQVAIYSLTKTGQEFAGSNGAWWERRA